jgi:hypothetical protein
MIKSKKLQWIMTVLLAGILIQSVTPIPVTAAPLNDLEKNIVGEAQALIPLSIWMVDQTIVVLSNGWENLDPLEQDLLNDIYDPGGTGEIDQAFVDRTLANYKKIRNRLANGLIMEYATDSKMCTGMRLFYTDFMRIYICPYFTQEDDIERKARVLIHEVAHMALLVADRPYYDPKSYSSRYNALTPQGSWATEIPVVGHIIREIARSDTLYHPDAYSWFAALVSM